MIFDDQDKIPICEMYDVRLRGPLTDYINGNIVMNALEHEPVDRDWKPNLDDVRNVLDSTGLLSDGESMVSETKNKVTKMYAFIQATSRLCSCYTVIEFQKRN